MYHHERRERRRRRLARRSLCSSRAAGFHHRATFSTTTTTTRHAHDASFVPRAQVATMAEEAEAVPVPPAAPPADEPETCIPPPPRPGCDCGARRSSPPAIERSVNRAPLVANPNKSSREALSIRRPLARSHPPNPKKIQQPSASPSDTKARRTRPARCRTSSRTSSSRWTRTARGAR